MSRTITEEPARVIRASNTSQTRHDAIAARGGSSGTRGPAAPAAVATLLAPTVPTSTLPAPTAARRAPSRLQQVFLCPEESEFYSLCIEQLLMGGSAANSSQGRRRVQRSLPRCMVEFGTGDGAPVLDCLMRTRYDGEIHGFELGKPAADRARSRARELGLQNVYQVHDGCFYKGSRAIQADCLIANPPYLPAPDDNIMMPTLRGGEDGSGITKDLLSLGYERCMLLVAAYSDPLGTLVHARRQGYRVADFRATPLPFGTYSSEPKVRNWIRHLESEGKAFCGRDFYMLTGVLFERQDVFGGPDADDVMDTELVKVLTTTDF